jgi:transcriptional regulator with XRE-family HTH domain
MKTRQKRTESAAVRAEIRVWMARRGVSGAQLAAALGHAPSWVSKRIGKGATVLLTVDDLYAISEALEVSPIAFIEPPAVPQLSYDGNVPNRKATELMPYRYRRGTIVPIAAASFPDAA